MQLLAPPSAHPNTFNRRYRCIHAAVHVVSACVYCRIMMPFRGGKGRVNRTYNPSGVGASGMLPPMWQNQAEKLTSTVNI